MDLHVLLTDIGLTKNESKVYLSLLELGQATAVEITNKSKVHRVNCYDVLSRLQEKGLISSIMQSSKKIYCAADPNQLMNLIKEREELLDKAMPQLRLRYTTQKEKQQVYHFFGSNGVYQAYNMMLEQNQDIHFFGGSGLNRKHLKHKHEIWNKERLRKKIGGKGIYFESTRDSKKKAWKDDPYFKIRYLPDKYKTLCMVDVCGDLVINLLPIEDNIMAIVIENKTLAESYRQFFNFMWDHANE